LERDGIKSEEESLGEKEEGVAHSEAQGMGDRWIDE